MHAEERALSFVGSLKKTMKAHAVVGIIGCVARNLGARIIERLPRVDLVCGPNDLSHLYDHVTEIQKKRKHIVMVSAQERDKSFYKYLYHHDKKRCYVNISEGCSNFCSYCVVPHVRGCHRSRRAQDIVREIKDLVKDGIKSITLLGQNVNDYNSDYTLRTTRCKHVDFPTLLEIISDIPGIKELGFVTSHPKDMNLRIFDIMAQKPNINKYLHLPVQSGSNTILKAMNRKYTREKYLQIVKAYRKKIPHGVLATDIIVGFPGETEKDFKATLALVKRVRFNFAYIFKYSPRPHTAAARFEDNVPLKEKKRRHQVLLEEQRKISKKLKQGKFDTQFSVPAK